MPHRGDKIVCVQLPAQLSCGWLRSGFILVAFLPSLGPSPMFSPETPFLLSSSLVCTLSSPVLPSAGNGPGQRVSTVKEVAWPLLKGTEQGRLLSTGLGAETWFGVSPVTVH